MNKPSRNGDARCTPTTATISSNRPPTRPEEALALLDARIQERRAIVTNDLLPVGRFSQDRGRRHQRTA